MSPSIRSSERAVSKAERHKPFPARTKTAMRRNVAADLQLEYEAALASNTHATACEALARVFHHAASFARGDLASAADAAIVATAAARERAELGHVAAERSEWRDRAIDVCAGDLGERSPVVAAALANTCVDAFFDRHAFTAPEVQQRRLAVGREHLEYHVVERISPTEAVAVLSQQSAIVRCQALISREHRDQLLDTAVSCARRAIEIDDADGLPQLHLANALLSQARYTVYENTAFKTLRLAKEALQKSCNGNSHLGWLGVARFFRQTHEPEACIRAFTVAAKRARSRRLVLREAYVAAEAAIQLSYGGYSSTLVHSALTFTESLLSEAIARGYETARIFIALALIQAAQDKVQEPEVTLRRLASSPSSDWLGIARAAARAIATKNDSALAAFACGMDDPFVWNGLGTYASRFLRDTPTAEEFFLEGIARDPQNPILRTNLARACMRRGSIAGANEAKKHLVEAAKTAGPLFPFWRDVRNTLEASYPDLRSKRRQQLLARPTFPPALASFASLERAFLALEGGRFTEADRGRRFQEIFIQLIALSTFGDVISPGWIGRRQFDGRFHFENVGYLIEAKWTSRALEPKEFGNLTAKLRRVPGQRGLCASMAGFGRGFLDQARDGIDRRDGVHVILFGGTDLRALFRGAVKFEHLFEQKLCAYVERGEPYLPYDSVLQGVNDSSTDV